MAILEPRLKNKVNYFESSFRDPEGRVFEASGKIFRTLAKQALPRIQTLLNSAFFQDLIKENLFVPTKMIAAAEMGLDPAEIGEYIIEHEKIEIITLPYEWSFDMLKEAALNHLTILRKSVENGYILKDGTAFNLAYRNNKMCFIDLLSFDDYIEGQPWEGYTQFCQEFLIPLMLTAYKKIEFQTLWRGYFKGIPISDFSNILNMKDYFRPGIFRHVVLQNMLANTFSKNKPHLKDSFKNKLFSKEILLRLIINIENTIQKLEYDPKKSIWINYEHENSYDAIEEKVKEEFVMNGLRQMQPRQVVDLGANTGHYSKLVEQECERVISLDYDPTCINNLFLKLKKDNKEINIIPMVGDLLNPSPSQGWALKERSNLFFRIKSDFFLALAVIHHLCITANVPLEYFITILKEVGEAGIVEWVDKKDEMVQFMLRNRKDIFNHYTWENFKQILEKHFVILKVMETQKGMRKICLVRKK